MKTFFLILLSFSALADYDDMASCVYGNHNGQRFRETGYSAEEACEQARIKCERQSRMVCFEIDREEGYDYDEERPFPGGDDGYDDWTVINGRRVHSVVCKVPIISRHNRSVIARSGRTPREACQKALRACELQEGSRSYCGRPRLERNYHR